MSSRKLKPTPQGAQIIPFPIGTPKRGKPQPITSRPDLFEEELDLTELLVKNPDATCAVRVCRESADLDIHIGDVLVVDRSTTPRPGELAVYEEDNDLVIRKYNPRPVAAGETPAAIFATVLWKLHPYRKGGAS